MNTTKQEIVPFLYRDTTIRTILIDQAPWFVAKDVCQALGIGNTTQAINGISSRNDPGLGVDEKDLYQVNTLGGPQQVAIINEPGLYRLVFKSRKKEAQAFQRWVYHEVLPSIRRTGTYGAAGQAYLALVREQIAMGVNPDLAARSALRLTVGTGAGLGVKPAAALDPIAALERDLLALMEAGTLHTPGELRAKLPPVHDLRTPNEDTDKKRIGWLMKRAADRGLIQIIPGRHARYRLANPDNIVSL